MTEVIQRDTVSHSEVESYLRCERQHFYGYGMEIQRQPGQESDSLFRGTVGHKCLEAGFNALILLQDEYAGILPSHVKTAREKALAETILAADRPEVMKELIQCLSIFFDNFPFYGWRILAVEQEYVMPVAPGLNMPFVVDLLARDAYGAIWLIDNKFVYDFYSSRDTELMPQLPKYYVGLKALGIHVDKMAYSMYRYRSQKSTDPDKYYKFEPVTFTNARLMQTITEQVVVSDRILTAKLKPLEEWSGSAMRTANSMVCNNCSVRSLCVAELNDWQPNLVLNSEYQKKQRREFVTNNG